MNSDPRMPRSLRAMLVLALGLWLVASGALANPIEVHGAFGFAASASRTSGHGAWDLAPVDTTLAEMQFGVRPATGLLGFVHLGARLVSAGGEPPRFTLREAAFTYTHRWLRGDSLELRGFARQPSVVWLDHGLVQPLAPQLVSPSLQGVRLRAGGHALEATLIAADLARTGDESLVLEPGDTDLLLARLRADLPHGVRLGATFFREVPVEPQVRRRDVTGFDARWNVAGTLLQVQFEDSEARLEQGVVGAADERRRWQWESGRVTDILPTTAALRAEARAPRLAAGSWGWFGFAPSFRAVGRHFVNRWQRAEPDLGTPRRGFEGYRLEAWYEAAGWPLWVRQAYDRHQQFADADRRIIRQTSEVNLWLLPQLRGRLQYRQQQVQQPGSSQHHNDLLLELAGAVVPTGLRAQFVLVDMDSPSARQALSLETTARLGARLHAVGRNVFWRQPGRVRRSGFIELQYWSLPDFEVALAWGPDWVGDSTEPVLAPDAGPGSHDRILLHLRGWF